MEELNLHFGHIVLFYQFALMERYDDDGETELFLVGLNQTASTFQMTQLDVLVAFHAFLKCSTRWKLK